MNTVALPAAALPMAGRAATSTGQPAYPEVPRVLTAAFSLYLLVWFLEVGKRVPLLGALRFEFLLGGLLTLVAIVSISQRMESNQSLLTKYITAYFIFLFLHLAISQYVDVSWNAFVDWVLKFSCVTLFTYAFVRNPYTLRVFVGTLLLVFFKIGQEAFIGSVTGSMIWENQGIMRLNGAIGTRFGHPNSLSALAVGMLPFFYYLLPVVKRWWKPVLLLLVVFAGNMIIFTGSRTGYIGVIALSGFLWLRSGRKGRFLAVILVLSAIGLPSLPEQYQGRFMSTFVGEEIEGHSKAGRLEIAGDAWELFLANPQGMGIYAFRHARAGVLHKPEYDTHNLYLQLLVDLGIGGTVVFAMLLFGLFRELRSTDNGLAHVEKALRIELSGGSKGSLVLERHLADVRFMRATAAAFLAYVFVRIIVGVFGHDLYEIYWWLAAGASMAIVNMQPLVEERTAQLLGQQDPDQKTPAQGSWAR